jgi:hypothetical protein
MTDIINNPWQSMPPSTRRRVDADTPHDIFWITDLYGNFGFCIQTKKIFKENEPSANLKGISVAKNNSESGCGELFLILNKKEDWQIFHTLCQNLSAVARKYEADDKMISAVEVRLQRWQELLKKSREREMTLEMQMGLFSELTVLKDIIVLHYGIRTAVLSWVGPQFDKQDFLLDDSVIEVKSFRTSKGPIVNISSPHQLYSDKLPLYLISCGLTATEKGKSIEDIVMETKEILENEAVDLIEIFETKIADYGYFPEISIEPLNKFITDSVKIFSIEEEFPRIVPHKVKSQIVTLKYSVDLSKCSEFEIKADLIFNKH